MNSVSVREVLDRPVETQLDLPFYGGGLAPIEA